MATEARRCTVRPWRAVAVSAEKKPGWKEIKPGGLIREPAGSTRYETGTWRTMRPVRDPARCTHCTLCWISCPDAAIELRDGKVVGINYAACKGCGICALECPARVEVHAATGRPGKAIQMIEEEEARELEERAIQGEKAPV
jgi:pyruvate ferredoxin oxidoreductase delta subunit